MREERDLYASTYKTVTAIKELDEIGRWLRIGIQIHPRGV